MVVVWSANHFYYNGEPFSCLLYSSFEAINLPPAKPGVDFGTTKTKIHPQGWILWLVIHVHFRYCRFNFSHPSTSLRDAALSNPGSSLKILMPPKGYEDFWRREWDSNPRWVAPSPVFKTGSLNRSDISPCELNHIISSGKSQEQGISFPELPVFRLDKVNTVC